MKGLRKKLQLTEYELDCIRFYMGDPEIVNRGDFRGGPKAYNTINALLHDGIQNELDKIRDKKPIEILDGEHLRNYVDLIGTIYGAMQKRVSCGAKLCEDASCREVLCEDTSCREVLCEDVSYREVLCEDVSCRDVLCENLSCRDTNVLTTYRVDRLSEIAPLQQKRRIEGFYSTCKRGYLSEYANTKTNVVLLEITRDADVPYLDFEELFEGYYAKPQEAEILLSFDARVTAVEEMELTDEERALYRDADGQEPRGKYRVLLSKNVELCAENSNDLCKKDKFEGVALELASEPVTWAELSSKETIVRIQKCFLELRRYRTLTAKDLEFYTNWKQKLKVYIIKNMRQA